MDETKYFKNRKWVIKAGIGFLGIVALLTFFSNTIMNYSLPQVRTQPPTSGTISESIKGSGTVTAVKQTKIISADSREIQEVFVYLDQDVFMGDTIATLVPIKESEELKMAQAELDALLKAKEQDELNEGLIEYDYTTYEEAIAAAQQTLTDANAVLTKAQGKSTAVAAAQTAVNTAQATVDNLDSALSSLNLDKNLILDNIAYYNDNLAIAISVYGEGSPEAIAAQALYDDERDTLDAKEIEITNKTAALQTAQNTLTAAQTTLQTAENIPTVAEAQKDVASAQKALDAAKKSLSDQKKRDYVAQQLAKMSKEDRDKAIEAAEKKVDELTALSSKNEIIAGATGRISSISISAGSETSKDMVLATIDDLDAGFTVSISLENRLAEQLQVNMYARNGEEYSGPEEIAYITAIRIDPDNPTTHKLIVFRLVDLNQGDYYPYYMRSGYPLTLSMNNRSLQYACIIPNSSIHEDGEGKFVYVLQQKNSPLGERFKAIRVSIIILATDGVNSAVDPAVINNQAVITMSTKTLEDGKQVRVVNPD
jgi:multidrug efflux pump subunit AcrA (membrane-fusion protein)